MTDSLPPPPPIPSSSTSSTPIPSTKTCSQINSQPPPTPTSFLERRHNRSSSNLATSFGFIPLSSSSSSTPSSFTSSAPSSPFRRSTLVLSGLSGSGSGVGAGAGSPQSVNRSRNTSIGSATASSSSPSRNSQFNRGVGLAKADASNSSSSSGSSDEESDATGSDRSEGGGEGIEGLMIKTKKGKRRKEIVSTSKSDPGSSPITEMTKADTTVNSNNNNVEVPSLGQYIQQKRRQASGPFHTLAPRTSALFGFNGGFTSSTTCSSSSSSFGSVPNVFSTSAPNSTTGPLSMSMTTTTTTTMMMKKEEEITTSLIGDGFNAPNRTRSRPASRRGTVSNLHLGSLPSSNAAFYPDSDLDSAMVMTPTTEEWRSLGGHLSLLADIRDKDEAKLLALERRMDHNHSVMTPLSRNSLHSLSLDSTTTTSSETNTGSSNASTSSSLDLPFNTEATASSTAGEKKRSPLSLDKLGSERIPSTPPPPPPLLLPSSSASSSSTGSNLKTYGRFPSLNDPVTPPAETVKSSFGYQTSRSGFTHSGAISTRFGWERDSTTMNFSVDRRSIGSSNDQQQQRDDGEDFVYDDNDDDGMMMSRTRTEPLKQHSQFVPSHRPQQRSESSVSLISYPNGNGNGNGGNRPNLSRGSLSTPTGTPSIGRNEMLDPFEINHGNGMMSSTSSNNKPSPLASHSSTMPSVEVTAITGQEEEATSTTTTTTKSQMGSAAPLDHSDSLGAIDPRTYSAVTGLRTIHSFLIESEAGRGAYGTVQKAQEKGPDGQAFGPTVIIKYIIKQRILADCWKKHKILGPIPIEVHVLDHLRRVPFVHPEEVYYNNNDKTTTMTMGRRRRRRREGEGGGGFRRKNLGGKVVRRDSAASIKLEEGQMTGHPNICGMLDFFEDREFYYLVMPQAGPPPSNDLFDYVDLHPSGLPPSKIHSILSQLCSALDFLHSHNIVHRDIKDENIILSSSGNVQLIDFGSAAYVKDGKKFDTFSGTLDFAAPEVLRGARYGGKEQDIWALGVLGYVLICGECPFWSPEEAMKGLEEGSRAGEALKAKVLQWDAALQGERLNRTAREKKKESENGLENTGTEEEEAGRTEEEEKEEEEEEEEEDVESQVTMSEAVDLVKRCLEIDPLDRPSAQLVCDHQFLLGRFGWEGRRGWE